MKFYLGRSMGLCSYSQFDKASKSMKPCGAIAVCMTKDGAAFVGLCKEHADFLFPERAECFRDTQKEGRPKWQEIGYKQFGKLI
jgi:hypothetical protein